jgi:hypothetical protein
VPAVKLSNLLLLLIVAAAPVAMFAPEALARQLIATIAASALLAVAVEAPPGLLRHLARIQRPWIASFACAAAYLAAQLLPIPVAAPAHPVWSGVAAALTPPPFGHVTIDLGATLLSLETLLACFAVALTAAAVAIERARAERALFWVAGASTAAAVALAAGEYVVPSHGDALAAGLRWAPFAAASGLGLIVNLALIFHVAETEGAPAERRTPRRRALKLAILGISAAVCFGAVATRAPLFVGAAVGVGVVGFLVVAIIRRLGMSFWPAALTATAAAALVIIPIAHGFSATTGDLLWRFATSADASDFAACERALADVGWFGGGAGVSAELLSIYRDFGALSPIHAPTTAADWTFGLGKPAVAVVLLWAIGASIFLFWSAFARGRDWIYAAAAAAAILTLEAEAFTDLSLATPAVGALAAALLGLGVGQSVSRSASSPD